MRDLHLLLELLLARLDLNHDALELALAHEEALIEGRLREDNLREVPRERLGLVSI